jgi:hypothetical protein
MSTAVVAGAAALVAAAHPGWGPDRIKAALTGTADPVGQMNGSGAGALDLGAALGTGTVPPANADLFPLRTVGRAGAPDAPEPLDGLDWRAGGADGLRWAPAGGLPGRTPGADDTTPDGPPWLSGGWTAASWASKSWAAQQAGQGWALGRPPSRPAGPPCSGPGAAAGRRLDGWDPRGHCWPALGRPQLGRAGLGRRDLAARSWAARSYRAAGSAELGGQELGAVDRTARSWASRRWTAGACGRRLAVDDGRAELGQARRWTRGS